MVNIFTRFGRWFMSLHYKYQVNFIALLIVSIMYILKFGTPFFNQDFSLFGVMLHMHHGTVAVWTLILSLVGLIVLIGGKNNYLDWLIVLAWLLLIIDAILLLSTEQSFTIMQLMFFAP